MAFSLLFLSSVYAQENSPYSRYGIGDLVPNQNVANRGMGGVSAGYADYQNINFVNPASLGYISNTIFDLGGEVDVRTLKSTTAAEKYRATNTLISYLQLGFPLYSGKLKKTDTEKNVSWGMSFGLRPLSRINYKISKSERLSGIDSLNTLYEGTGGINQVNLGTGFRIKNLSAGINAGYSFGNKDYSTKLNFINDTVSYFKSNSGVKTQFGGLFMNVGVHYAIKMKKGILNLGAYSNLQQNLKASKSNIDETIIFDGNGASFTIDTVNYSKDVSGRVKIPATYGAGFTFASKNWLLGMDFETTNWNSYRNYGEKDAVQDSWTVRGGAQYYPAKENTASKKYWSFVKYRAGFYLGPDYIKLNQNRMAYAATVGASLPLTSFQRIRFGEYVLMNTAVEIGARGNKETFSVRENYTRFSIGISMNARWFQKRSYD